MQPPLADRELNDLFMGTLPAQYYERLIGNTSSSFSELVIVGEKVEEGLKSGKISGGTSGSSSVKKPFNGYKKKEGEANAVYDQRGRGRGRQSSKPTPIQVPYMQYPYVAAVQYPGMPYQQPMQMQIPMQIPIQVSLN